MDLTTIIVAVLAAIGGGGGVWGVLAARVNAQASAPAALTTALAGFQDALSRQSSAFNDTLIKLTEHQQAELGDLRAEVQRLAFAERDCQERNATLERDFKAHARQAEQKIASLVNLLRRAGFDIPKDIPLDKLTYREEDGVFLFQGQPISEAKR